MENKHKVIAFAVLASISAATTAKTASIYPLQPRFIVLPLVLMGIFLFFAGYYVGLSKKPNK